MDLTLRVEERFEWLEVTEVFTTVPAARIEGAMRAWNRIPDRDPVEFDEFRKGLPRGRPSRLKQRRAADCVIAQIERKLAKASYHELLAMYGYGTLVVGMPLWFAVPPDDPFRAENAVDDFTTRTKLGLEDVKRRVLRRRDCPFRKVIVKWDVTPEALRAWREERSAEYEDAANASLGNPLGASMWGVLADALEKGMSETATPESEAPSMRMYLEVETTKKASGTGPYPKLVEALGQVLHERYEKPAGLWARLKLKVVMGLWKLLCFLRVHGVGGLERWIGRKFSVTHAWRARAVGQKARRLYRESRRRGRVFGGPHDRDGGDGRRRWSPTCSTASPNIRATESTSCCHGTARPIPPCPKSPDSATAGSPRTYRNGANG